MNSDTTLDFFQYENSVSSVPSLDLERTCWAQGYSSVAGVDEAGRGSLSGPVVAAAVILPIECRLDGVKDSKQLTPRARVRLAATIKTQALAVATGFCSPAEIDEMNILQAALEAMRRAVSALSHPADFILIDGNACFTEPSVPARTIIKGDARSHSIAAASIIAKTTRDAYMVGIHKDYPRYAWDANKGYPTSAHYEALSVYGPSPHHRRSFRLY